MNKFPFGPALMSVTKPKSVWDPSSCRPRLGRLPQEVIPAVRSQGLLEIGGSSSLKGTETLITRATSPFTNRSFFRTTHGRRGSTMPETPLNARFLSLKHSSHGWRASPLTRCRTSRIVSQGCLSMTGRRSESQVSGMI